MPECKNCKEVKEVEGFHKNRGKPSTVCKICVRKREKEFYNNPENKITKRTSTLKRKYGLDYKVYQELLVQQDFSCLICTKKLVEFGEKAVTPHVDHCHTTGIVRGILCCYCNSLLGRFKDDITLFQNAIKYLTENTIENKTT